MGQAVKLVARLLLALFYFFWPSRLSLLNAFPYLTPDPQAERFCVSYLARCTILIIINIQ